MNYIYSFVFPVDGNLSGMLVDEAGCPSPLEADQGLYYFRQLLLGVKFLHDSNVLHLDIKGLNLLVFDEGKTLKLCDFGTAVRMDDMAASGGRKNCMTPLFAAPEVSDNSNILVRYLLIYFCLLIIYLFVYLSLN